MTVESASVDWASPRPSGERRWHAATDRHQSSTGLRRADPRPGLRALGRRVLDRAGRRQDHHARPVGRPRQRAAGGWLTALNLADRVAIRRVGTARDLVATTGPAALSRRDPGRGLRVVPRAAADGRGSKTAVLICPPWGWDEVASYRSRRAWAEHLAERGHPTLRIDFPGSGDSAGSPADPGRVEAWTAAVIAATTWLADSTPSGRGRRHRARARGPHRRPRPQRGRPDRRSRPVGRPDAGTKHPSRAARVRQAAERPLWRPSKARTRRFPKAGWRSAGSSQTAETIAAIQKLDLRDDRARGHSSVRCCSAGTGSRSTSPCSTGSETPAWT